MNPDPPRPSTTLLTEPSSSVGDGEIDGLLDQARTAGDPFLSVELYKKALLVRSEDIGVMEEAAELMLHVGETTAAKEVRQQSIYLQLDTFKFKSATCP